ncbi:MAG: IS21 family transposase [Planctomycetes bacterium]|nr:IS21 family transposase [Planctomycetota bacterium]
MTKGKQPKVIYDVLCREQGKDFVASYDAVYRLVRRLRRERGVRPEEVAIPLVTRPGLQAQIDFGYVGKVFDSDTGRVRKAWVFVLTLAHSRHMVVRLVFDQSEATWLRCHVEAFEELGGVPEFLVPDNTKAAVIRRAFALDEETTLNRSYRELARHYGAMIDPTPVRDPKKKGRVESGVKYVKRGHFATRELETSDAITERRELQRWVVAGAGGRPPGTTRRRPREAFEAEERATLKPLPASRFELRRWAKATVHDDSHVRFERAFYSVPFVHLRQEVMVCGTATSVLIYLDGRRLATHARVGAGRWTRSRSTCPSTARPTGTATRRSGSSARTRSARGGLRARRAGAGRGPEPPAPGAGGRADPRASAARRAEAASRRALHFGNLSPKARGDPRAGARGGPGRRGRRARSGRGPARAPRFARTPAELVARARSRMSLGDERASC